SGRFARLARAAWVESFPGALAPEMSPRELSAESVCAASGPNEGRGRPPHLLPRPRRPRTFPIAKSAPPPQDEGPHGRTTQVVRASRWDASRRNITQGYTHEQRRRTPAHADAHRLRGPDGRHRPRHAGEQ